MDREVSPLCDDDADDDDVMREDYVASMMKLQRDHIDIGSWQKMQIPDGFPPYI